MAQETRYRKKYWIPILNPFRGEILRLLMKSKLKDFL